MNEVYTKPRTGDEMQRATGGVPIALYSRVCDLVDRYGVGRVLSHMFSKSPKWIILLQNPKKMNSGHWLGLEIFPATKEIMFFSSYGGKPDVEKLEWIPEDLQILSSQNTNALNDGLKLMARRGWTVHYNDHPFQFEGDNTATCGIWTAAFLNSGMNPEAFYYYSMFNNYGPEEYFQMYFSGRNDCRKTENTEVKV